MTGMAATSPASRRRLARLILPIRGTWFRLPSDVPRIGALAAAMLCVCGAATAAPSGDPLAGGGLGGARLGMSLAQWRALPTPRPGDPHVVRVCQAQGEALVTCRYADRYGRIDLPQALDFGKDQRAWQVRYRFREGQLEAIAFLASIDGYNALTAQIGRAYGKPIQSTVDRTPSGRTRVRSTWRHGADRVELVDPSPNPARLEISLTRSDDAFEARAASRIER